MIGVLVYTTVHIVLQTSITVEAPLDLCEVGVERVGNSQPQLLALLATTICKGTIQQGSAIFFPSLNYQ